MTVPKEIVWDIEPHTLAKHEILRRYLGAWFPILGAYNRRIVYLDGFCGPGRYRGGEAGSPIIALQEAIKHSDRLRNTEIEFFFVDERADRISHLCNELKTLPHPDNYHISVTTGEFETELTDALNALDANGLHLPTFAFIDPFGIQGLPFSLVSRLLTNQKTEVFVNIMADSVNRFLTHPDDKIRNSIVDLFGTQEVLQVAQTTGDRMHELRLLYQRQLAKSARFVRHFEMKDCNNRTKYYLFFAGNHPLGHAKMKEAFWKVDPTSGFSFSDATNPTQLILFETNETPKLASDLASEFAKKMVPIEQIKRYVEDNTPFTATHMRKSLSLLETQGGGKVSKLKTDGEKRRKNSYSDKAIFEFC